MTGVDALQPWPNTIRRPVIVDDVTGRCGGSVYSSTEVWLHRSHDQLVSVSPELVTGKPLGSGIVAVLDQAGGSTVLAIEDAAGVATMAIVNDRALEVGAIRWDVIEVA